MIPKTIKLIAFDLDGTLLTDKKKIRHKSVRYIKNAAERNLFVVLSSGRPYRAIEKYYKQLKLKTPIICYNGAFIYDPEDSEFVKTCRTYNKEIVKDIYSKIPSSIIEGVMLEDNDNIWVDRDDTFLFLFYLRENMKVHQGKISNILDKDPLTFIIKYVNTEENRKIILNAVEPYKDTLGIRFWGCDSYCELYYKDINKYEAICKVAKQLNIDFDDVICFGDADNDIEMLEKFEYGIAMQNSPKEVKKIAKFITKKDNNHNGAVDFLKTNKI